MGPVKSITLWTTGQEVEFPYRKPRTKHKISTPAVPVDAPPPDPRPRTAPTIERSRVSWEEGGDIITASTGLHEELTSGFPGRDSYHDVRHET